MKKTIFATLILVGLTLTSFNSFSAKVTGERVRLRIQASLDAPIFGELHKEDYLTVVGEKGDFYAVAPPKEVKGYLFRQYILDNVVEASYLNIRSAPTLDAPIIGKLNKGQTVEGTPCVTNPKWLEVNAANYCTFYVAKQYLQEASLPIQESTKETLLTLTIALPEAPLIDIQPQEAPLVRSPAAVEPKGPVTSLEGVITRYTAAVSNPPGNFILSVNQTPVAFLSSQEVDLQTWVGKKAHLICDSKPNKHFAYPAYNVLSIELTP